MGCRARRSVPDGRICVRRGARRKPCSVLWLLVVAVHGAASTGCSFVYTRGPRPEVQPPPPCTTSYIHPIADTVLGAVSVGVTIWAATGFHAEKIRDGTVIAGLVATAVFVPSAVTGFGRTYDCRAWLQANPQYAPQPAPSTSSSLLVPVPGCPSQGDAPLVCSSRASWESSALVLNAPSGGGP